VHKVLKCHDAQMVSSSPIVDTLWSLNCPILCIENLLTKPSSSKSAIRTQISSVVRRPMPPPPVPTPQKTDLTPATENMNLDPRLDSQPNGLAHQASTHAGSLTSLARGNMNTSRSQGEETNDEQMRRLRGLLMPPPIDGLVDWGIPPATTEPCDTTLEVCLHKPSTTVYSNSL
jgi:hypothetical protein